MGIGRIVFLQKVSLKWRLSIALIGLSLSLVSIYIMLAKDTFESDKIAYVYETKQIQVESESREISRQIDKIFLDLKPFKSFDSKAHLLELVVTSNSKKEPEIHYKKENVPQAVLENSVWLHRNLEDTENHRIQVLASIPSLQGSLKHIKGINFILQNEQVVLASQQFNLPETLLKDLSLERTENIKTKEIDGEKYVISVANIAGTELKLVSLEAQSAILSAIDILYRRSILFLSFTSFMTILVSLVLSKSLTQKLNDLTVIAGEIGKGDFSHRPLATSTDEVGILQSAISRMIDEIQNLLLETKEKTRMEEELKTARLVQERLFPLQTQFEKNNISVAGIYETSTECGGDWWFYFEDEDDLLVIIADATGHGTPAALSTAASRSVFSVLQMEPKKSLLEIADLWDRAIAASSGQKVFMTALMLKINTKTGQGSYVNASHEAPLIFSSDREGEFLEISPSSPLGELTQKWQETNFEIKSGERVFLFTDGFWAVENPEHKSMSEARLIKKLKTISDQSPKAHDFLVNTDKMIQDYRKGAAYPDDVTMVVVQHQQLAVA